jgi:hypothetical protein
VQYGLSGSPPGPQGTSPTAKEIDGNNNAVNKNNRNIFCIFFTLKLLFLLYTIFNKNGRENKKQLLAVFFLYFQLILDPLGYLDKKFFVPLTSK